MPGGGGTAAASGGSGQGNGETVAMVVAAGNGQREGAAGPGVADGEARAAAVPMLPALEVAEEPEKAAGGRSKDPNTYKVLSLVSGGGGLRGNLHREVLKPWGAKGKGKE